jgi:uncharacterized membrane protein YidH (DUF202 family)
VEATLANSNVPPLAHPAVAGFQIALGVIIGGLTIALLVMGFFVWNSRQRNERLAVGLFISGAVIVVVLVVMVASH